MLRSFVFGYLVIVSFVTARITVTVSKTRYNVLAGNDVTLDCSISSDNGPLDSVYWTTKGGTVYSSDLGYNWKYSGSSIADPSLTIRRTTTYDSGYYNCKGKRGRTEVGSSQLIDLRVTEGFAVSVSKTQYSVQAGNDVTLDCWISSNRGPLDSVYWEKDYVTVYRSSDGGSNGKYSGSTVAEPSLTIRSTTTGDSGDYKCYGSKGSTTKGSRLIILRVTEVIVLKTTYSVEAGSPVTLRCWINPRFGLTTTSWTKAGRSQQVYSSDSQRNEKYYIPPYSDQSLTIRDTVVEDSGTYTCRVLKSSGAYSSSPINLTSSDITLTVYKPFSVSISPHNTDITVLERDSVGRRTCSSDDCPSECVIEWILPNGVRRTSDIFTRPVTREQAGTYTCKASFGNFTKSTSFYVTVNHGPENISLSPPGDMSKQEGESIYVRCQASCSPSCNIYWTGPNTYQTRRRGPSLSILRVDRTDGGVYQCMASNDYGNISSSLRLNVKYGPGAVDLKPTTLTYMKLEGSTIPNILCTADCNPACHVTWRRNTDRISENGTLSLGSLDTSKDGTYTCTARGGTLSTTKTITVKTLYGPKTISLSPPGDVSAQEGERISVRCLASCFPPCNISWTGPNTYPKGRHNPLLSIGQADKTNRGVYYCNAVNDYGNTSTTLRVNVNYAGSDIKLVPNDTQYSSKEGTVLPDIRCVAECNPACDISWYHDRTGSVFDGNNLSLKKTERSKDGNYMCNATNHLGRQTLSLTVVSLFPPEVLRKDLLNSSYTVHEGDSVFSSCSVDASPLPDAVLMYAEVDQQGPSTKVPLQFLRQPFPYRTRFSFSIINITYSDVGHYTLNVSNSQGAFTYKFSIDIINNASLGLEGDSDLTIVWVIPLIAVIIIVILIVILIVFRRKQNKVSTGPLGVPRQPAEEAEHFIAIHNTERQPEPANDVYAEVVRPKRNNNSASAEPSTRSLYSVVTKPSKTDRAKSAGDTDIYSKVSKPGTSADNHQDVGPQTTRTTNQDGLMYLEVDFSKRAQGTGKVVIRGLENKCEYGEIDFSKKVSSPEDMEN